MACIFHNKPCVYFAVRKGRKNNGFHAPQNRYGHTQKHLSHSPRGALFVQKHVFHQTHRLKTYNFVIFAQISLNQTKHQ